MFIVFMMYQVTESSALKREIYWPRNPVWGQSVQTNRIFNSLIHCWIPHICSGFCAHKGHPDGLEEGYRVTTVLIWSTKRTWPTYLPWFPDMPANPPRSTGACRTGGSSIVFPRGWNFPRQVLFLEHMGPTVTMWHFNIGHTIKSCHWVFIWYII